MTADQILKWMLRIIGTSGLFAVIFVAAPYSWMDSIHATLGMGRLPDEPIVGYLARSTSALYAIMGGLFWVVSLDLERHRRVLTYLGVVVALFGVTLLVVDWSEGMPLLWTIWEGPVTVVFGLAMLFLARRTGSVRGASRRQRLAGY